MPIEINLPPAERQGSFLVWDRPKVVPGGLTKAELRLTGGRGAKWNPDFLHVVSVNLIYSTDLGANWQVYAGHQWHGDPDEVGKKGLAFDTIDLTDLIPNSLYNIRVSLTEPTLVGLTGTIS